MTTRRDRIDIILDILLAARGGATITNVVYLVNLNFKTANEYLEDLISKGLIDQSGESATVYRTSGAGVKMIDNILLIKKEADLIKIHEKNS
jgi:predicted transcriptional regulator